MKKNILMVAVITASLLASQAFAMGCYSTKELEAEQGLRIHSELMVIGLTCLKMPGGTETYAKYAAFTRKNKDMLAGYEDDLIAYYRTQGAKKPEQKLHTLRTNLANTISGHAVGMNTPNFCQHFTPRIDAALAMDSDTLHRWAQRVWPGTPVSQPVCASFQKQ